MRDGLRPTLALAAAAFAITSPACRSAPCCTVDSEPILLERAPGGALLARGAVDGVPASLLFDTGSPLSLIAGAPTENATVADRTFTLTDAPGGPARAVFRDIDSFVAPLGPVGTMGASTSPGAVIGGNLLRGYSLELRFAVPSVTFWPRLGTESSFLAAAGYAVIHFDLGGGGEIDAEGHEDFFGFRGPYTLPRTRVVFRACAAPTAFDPDAAPPLCCRNDEVTLATGADLALVFATGTGPLVLGESAFARVRERFPGDPPAPGPRLQHAHAGDAGLEARWATLPRLALVDLETSENADPGPCAELGRARRLEQVARRQASGPTDACAQPCDRDPSDRSKAQNSAAYAELGGAIVVAVVPDGASILQAARADVRAKGPEIDGLLGADVLRMLRVELDYDSSPSRAVLSCEVDACGAAADRARCWVGARCPRLPGRGSEHACFCLPPHGLPETCAEVECGG